DIAAFWNIQVASSSDLAGMWHFNNTSTDQVTGNTPLVTGNPIATSSTPFGHFILGRSAVATSTNQLLWYYSDPVYLDMVVSSTAVWNTLGSVTIASTTVGNETLDIANVSSTTGIFFGVPGLTI